MPRDRASRRVLDAAATAAYTGSLLTTAGAAGMVALHDESQAPGTA